VRRGGRQKGTPNRVTADARETFRLIFERLTPELEAWVRAAARRNPARGAELLLRLAEHFVPRVARHEVSTDGPSSLVVEIRKVATKDDELDMTEEALPVSSAP
jgi:hypothetical protein